MNFSNNKSFKLIFFILLFFVLTNNKIYGQTKLKYDTNGELDITTYNQLKKKKSYQVISAFDTVSFQPMLIYALYIKENKFGILDNNGIEITAARYDFIGMNKRDNPNYRGFHQNFVVSVNGKYGLISNMGKEIMPLQFDYAHIYPEKRISKVGKHEYRKDSIFAAIVNDVYQYFTPSGKRLAISEREFDENQRIQYERFENRNSNYVEPKKTTSIHGWVSAKSKDETAVVTARVDNKYQYGLVDLSNDELILPLEYKFMGIDRHNRVIASKSGSYSLLDSKGKPILAEEFESLQEFNGIYKMMKNGKTALFDSELKQKSDYVYEKFSSANGEVIVAMRDGKYGVIGIDCNEITEFIYDQADFYRYQHGTPSTAFIEVILNKKIGYLSLKNEKLTEIIYDEIVPECTMKSRSSMYYSASHVVFPDNHEYSDRNEYFIYRIGEKYGLLDKDFKPLIDANYWKIKKSFHPDFVVIGSKNEKGGFVYGLLNIRNKEQVLPFEYSSIESLRDEFFTISQGSNKGICDASGNVIIPIEERGEFSYDLIYDGLHQISINRKYFYLDNRLGMSFVQRLPR